MEIALIEPFFSGSHEQWARSFKKYSKHRVVLITLPGRNWKWRMHGGAISCARSFMERYGANFSPGSARDAVTTDARPQMLLATDMLDLCGFLAYTRRLTAAIPTALYFHENQFSYPARAPAEGRGRDEHYAFINYASALAADRIYFNSRFHRDDFLEQALAFPPRFPDFREASAAASLSAKSRVLTLGLELPGPAAARAARRVPGDDSSETDPPLILWNHRREHDKNPEDFFGVLFALKARGVRFRLAVLGQGFRETPPIFERARVELRDEIVRFEAAATREEYMRWLLACDLCPVTSHHDFFGAAVVEAMAAGCYPLLPRRLAYPEHVDGQARFLYEGNSELLDRLAAMLQSPEGWRNAATRGEIAELAARHSWSRKIADYDRELEDLAAGFR